MTEPQLVAFCDLLGTAARLREGSFDAAMSLDFANPLGLAATAAPHMRFAVFSDSCIFTCSSERAREFVSVLTFLCRNWFADGMLVRGGVACGDVRWVDDGSDAHFRRLPNLALSRVFGVGLLDAYETERAAPGAVIFVHPSAQARLRDGTDNWVVETTPPIVNWYDESLARHYVDPLDIWDTIEPANALRLRQTEATKKLLGEVVRLGKFLPSGFENEVLGKLFVR